MKQEIDNNAMWAAFRQELALQGELQVVAAIDNALNNLGFTIEETSMIIPIPLKQGNKDIGISEATKQGEQKPKFRIGDTIKKKNIGDIVTVSEVDLKNREYRLTNTGFIPFKYEYLWELVEQKPADKAEPKFKIGDWIIREQSRLYDRYIAQVIGIDDGHYYYDIIGDNGNCSSPTLEFVEEKYHLWTIQDAKEGDVLACPNDAGDRDVVFIFKNINSDEGWVFCFCASDANGCFCTNNDYVGNSNSTSISPATKEQRDLLFQKMRKADYEWDAEKLELRKIEQKPAWSEEDEDRLDIIFERIERGLIVDKDDIDRLKSLKERYTWKPSERLLESLQFIINNPDRMSDYTRSNLIEILEQLKKLREE